MINRKKLRVGQKVLLVKEVPAVDVVGGYVSEMRELLGKEVTISRLKGDYFEIKEDIDRFMWDYRFIKSIEPISKVHNVYDFEDEDYILPFRYSLEKVIENGNAVICWVEDCETREMIKTVAKCQEGDNFDLHKGVEICMYKTLRKIAEKNLKRF